MTSSHILSQIKSVNWWPKLWRPILAYLAASYSAGMVIFGVSAELGDKGYGFFGQIIVTVLVSIELAPFVALFTCVPAALSILIIRQARLGYRAGYRRSLPVHYAQS